MAWYLGVAVANIYQRIAELLAGGGLFPLPPGGGSSGGGNTGGGGSGGGGTPIPPPPLPGAPHPPNVVTLPPVSQFPPGPPVPEPCPPLSSGDMAALSQFEGMELREARGEGELSIASAHDQSSVPLEEDLMMAVGTGIPVESTDYFRFRAFGTAGVVSVTFYGRVMTPQGIIVPFSHVLPTDASGTIFQTIPRTGQGLLLGAAASVAINSISSGVVNAVGEIGRLSGSTFLPHTSLFSGQLDDLTPLSSTVSVPTAPVANGSYVRWGSASTDPQLIEIAVTPTAGRRMRFLYIGMSIECGASVFNRQVRCSLLVGSQAVWSGFANRVFKANQDCTFRLSINGQPGASEDQQLGLAILAGCPLPESLYFATPVTVQLFTDTYPTPNTDNIFNCFALVEEV